MKKTMIAALAAGMSAGLLFLCAGGATDRLIATRYDAAADEIFVTASPLPSFPRGK